MRKVPLILGVAAAALLAGNTASIFPSTPFSIVSQAEAAVNVSIFFEPLGRHGRWIDNDRYGYVWVPVGVGSRWAPYTHGHWVYTDRYGWYFASSDPYAWAVYHYGRWVNDDDIGWYWVPGTRWAPAWVSWRRGHDHIGWAPLPPSGPGYAVSFNIGNVEISASNWYYVPSREFLAPSLSVVIFEGDRYRDRDRFYRETKPVGPVRVENNIVVNNVIDVDVIEKETAKKVVVHKVEKVDDPQQQTASAEDGRTIKTFQPEIADAKPEKKPEKVADKEEVKAEKQAAEGNARAKPEGQAEAGVDAKAKTENKAEVDTGTKAKKKSEAEARTDGQTRAGEVKTEGQVRSGEVKTDGKARSNEAKSADDPRRDGQARSGEVKRDGQANAEQKKRSDAEAKAAAEQKKRSEAESTVKAQPKPEKRSDAAQPQGQDATAKVQDRIPENAGESRGTKRQADNKDEKKQKVN